MDPLSGMALKGIAEKIGIKGFISIGLGLAVIGMGIALHFVDADRDKWRKEAHQTELKLEVSNTSIANLTEQLGKFVGAGKAARVAQLAAIEAQAEKSADLRAEAEEIRQMARDFKPEDPCDCSTPGFVMEGRQ